MSGSGKIGENALAHLNRAPAGEKVEIDVTFSAQPYGMPFHSAGLDDNPRVLAQVRESVLSGAGIDQRDVTFDASDIGVMSVMIDAGQAQRLAAHPLVRSLGVLPEMRGFTAESATLSNFPYVWNAGFTGSGVKVAIIDVGFSPNHPALPTVPGPNQFCYARNGAVGRCANGVTFVQGVGAANYIGYKTGTNDGEYSQVHGTSVLATLVQAVVPGPTYTEPGLARGITPVLFNIAGGDGYGGINGTSGYTRGGFLDALQSMRNTGINSDVRIINMSFGFDRQSLPGNPPTPSCASLDTEATTTVLNSLHGEGKLLVAAAGNNGDALNVWPACVVSVVTVAAAWNKAQSSDSCTSSPVSAGAITCYSNRNSYIDLAAPGSVVTLARSRCNPPGTLTHCSGASSQYTHDRIERHGTSFAAPAAAACAALLKQANSSATPEQLRTALTTSPTTAAQPGSGFQRPLLDCAHALANSTAPRIPLANAGLSGAWYEPRTAGQGLYLNVYPSTATAFAGWFTYDTTDTGTTGRRWYTLQNTTPFSASATQTTMTIYRTVGGKFDAPPSVSAVAVGTATLSFTSCLSGRLSYSFSDGRNGVIPLSRLDSPFCSSTPSGDASYTGVWHRAGLDGQGMVLRVMPTEQKLIGGWFTFTSAGGATAASQQWYTLDNGEPGSGRPPGTAWNGTTNSANFGIYASSGGRFNQSSPTPTTSLVGSGSIQFTSCTSATLTYSFSAGGSGTISLTRLGPAPGPC